MNYKENKREDGITLLGLLIIIFAILLIIMIAILMVCMKAEENSQENLLSSSIENNITSDSARKTKNQNTVGEKVADEGLVQPEEQAEEQEEENGLIKPIKLKIKDKETLMSGDEILNINDYKIIIPNTFVEIGYDITEDGDTLNFKVKDGSYECVLLQLSDSYVMPTEEEVEAFYETEEYKTWDEEDVDYDDDEALEVYHAKYDEISTNYYKSLGYTPQDCPNYTLTNDELESLIGKYLIDRDDRSSGNTNTFPGYLYYQVYNWGETKLYTIPKYYNDIDFGESTSDFSIYLYMFEYYDTEDVSIRNLRLSTI